MSESERDERRRASKRGETASTELPREKAILVGIERPGDEWPLSSSLEELGRLVFTAGADVIATTSQRLSKPNPATFIGSGKVKEIASLAESTGANIIVFDDELTPSQQANLEKSVNRDIKVIDRTALILDIFALHAKSREGRLQVRLAQNQYLYPRLRGMWAHLASNRMGGGVGSRFGEGESQLEVDRRMVRNRITSIKKELATLAKVRAQQRSNRLESGIFKVALVGYTNAGKSSLLNSLSGSDVYSDDLLFATLDSTTRRLALPEGREITLTDTVGFIQKLPTMLVEAFRSTLDEVAGADLILHVVDVTSDDFVRQIEAVCEVIEQIGAATIPKVLVCNKIDLLDTVTLEALRRRYATALFVSSKDRGGLEELIEAIGTAAASRDELMHVLIPYDQGSIVSAMHRRCHVTAQSYTDAGIEMTARVPRDMVSVVERYRLATQGETPDASDASEDGDNDPGNGAVL